MRGRPGGLLQSPCREADIILFVVQARNDDDECISILKFFDSPSSNMATSYSQSYQESNCHMYVATTQNGAALVAALIQLNFPNQSLTVSPYSTYII